MYIRKISTATIADYVQCLGSACISNALHLVLSGWIWNLLAAGGGGATDYRGKD